MQNILLAGDCREILSQVGPNRLDSCVTDPPYGLSFMNKGWDHKVPGVDYWSKILDVLKPGGYLLAFGGTRTYHRMTCAIEDSGFEIRDCLSWLYGSGFPKSLNVSLAMDKAAGYDREAKDPPITPEAIKWAGYGTALKPAYEPIVMARKPLDGTVIQTVLEHGTGALPIDAGRAGDRFPSNLIHDGETGLGEESRYFYCAKASKAEREFGLENFIPKQVNDGRETSIDNPFQRGDTLRKNIHPTVKPIALMRYLVKLVAPPGGVVLDPFVGSGSTGVACKLENFDFVGIDIDPEFLRIAKARIEAHHV